MEIIYIQDKIRDFIKTLDSISRIRTIYVIDLLEDCGSELRMPHSKSLGDGLFELRIKGSKQIRIIYTYHNNTALLLNIFIKKTWGIPKKEIEYAKNILKLFIA